MPFDLTIPGAYIKPDYISDNTRSREPILVRDENGFVRKISYPAPDYVPLYYAMGSNSDGVLFTPENYKDAAESMFGENSRWAAAFVSSPVPPKIYPEFAPDPIAARISNLEIDLEEERETK